MKTVALNNLRENKEKSFVEEEIENTKLSDKIVNFFYVSIMHCKNLFMGIDVQLCHQ